MTTKPPAVVHVGAVVATPAGRLCVIRSVDQRRGEASVEGLPWAANFKVSLLRPASPGECVVILGNVTPAANDEEPEA